MTTKTVIDAWGALDAALAIIDTKHVEATLAILDTYPLNVALAVLGEPGKEMPSGLDEAARAVAPYIEDGTIDEATAVAAIIDRGLGANLAWDRIDETLDVINAALRGVGGSLGWAEPDVAAWRATVVAINQAGVEEQKRVEEWCRERDAWERRRHHEAVQAEVERRLVRAEADAIIAAMNAMAVRWDPDSPGGQFRTGTVREIIEEWDAPPRWRVHGLIPAGGATLVVAQRKTGKTTFCLNVAASLITGDPCLGRIETTPLATWSKVAVMNYELPAQQAAIWAANISPAILDRLIIASLRGRPNPLTDRARFDAFMEGLDPDQSVRSLIVDPFGSAYTGLSQNDAGEVRRWLDTVTAWAAEWDVEDVILTAHAGWSGDRSRGSSSLEDWADAIITLTRDETTGDRYMRAIGRDVDMPQDRLEMDENRRLTLTGTGGQQEAVRARHLDTVAQAVLAIVTGRSGLNGTEIEQQLKADGVPLNRGDHSRALASLERQGLLVHEPGRNNQKLWSPATSHPELPGATRAG